MDRATIEHHLQQHRETLAKQRAHVAEVTTALERGKASLAQLEGAVLALQAVLDDADAAQPTTGINGVEVEHVHTT